MHQCRVGDTEVIPMYQPALANATVSKHMSSYTFHVEKLEILICANIMDW